ncbi:MAG TPA: hypothetical protein VJV78_28700 [Polyangiales bacterium]|nr:hypothetical protein [Polyangiales bacterium]
MGVGMRGLMGWWVACALWGCAEVPAPRPAEQEARPADVAFMQQRLSRSARDLQVERMGRGVRKISLQGRFQHVAVVSRTDAGVARRACLDRPQSGF